MPLLYAAIATVLSFAASFWLLHPVLKPSGDINTRSKRGMQFSALVTSLVFGGLTGRALSNLNNIDLWFAALILPPLVWVCLFCIGWAIGPASLPQATYQPSSATIATHTPSSTQSAPTEAHWEQASNELELNHRRPGLCAKSFAEAAGNESIAKANYLRLRAHEIAKEPKDRVAPGGIVSAVEGQNNLDHKSSPLKLGASPPKPVEQRRQSNTTLYGVCSGCKATVNLSSTACHMCNQPIQQ